MMLALAFTFMVIILVGFVGNTIVLFVIVSNRQLHDRWVHCPAHPPCSTNVLICNLALADLLFLTFCVPLTAYSYIFMWDFSERVCYWMVTLQYATCYVSVWTLVLLAYDRFLVSAGGQGQSGSRSPAPASTAACARAAAACTCA